MPVALYVTRECLRRYYPPLLSPFLPPASGRWCHRRALMTPSITRGYVVYLPSPSWTTQQNKFLGLKHYHPRVLYSVTYSRLSLFGFVWRQAKGYRPSGLWACAFPIESRSMTITRTRLDNDPRQMAHDSRTDNEACQLQPWLAITDRRTNQWK